MNLFYSVYTTSRICKILLISYDFTKNFYIRNYFLFRNVFEKRVFC